MSFAGVNLMNRFVSLVIVAVLGGLSTLALAKQEGIPDPQLTAASIIEKNIVARGGSKAWQKINTMTWVGHIDIRSPRAPVHSMRFALKMKRPNKTRFEIVGQHQLSVRMYDGEHGWKVLPGGSGGMPRVKPFTKDELIYAHDEQSFDGPLIDYQHKGIKVNLEGVDQIQGHKAYRLYVTIPPGISHRVWIDAKTFLVIKYDRRTSNAFGMTATLTVTYHDYRKVNGVLIPFTIENGTASGKSSYNMVLDKVFINPTLDDMEFTKPIIPHRNSTRIRLGAMPTGPNPYTARPIHPSMAGAAGGH